MLYSCFCCCFSSLLPPFFPSISSFFFSSYFSHLFSVNLSCFQSLIKGIPKKRNLYNNLLSSADVCSLTDGWKKFNLSCYKFFNVKTKWDKAKQHCSDLGSILVTIHSLEENQFVASLAPTNTTIWIGASDTVLEGTWVWLDGENWGGYANWGGSNPNNSRGKENCALTVNGKWNDVDCNLSRTYVCKTKN